jgi:hypothetical protein
MFRFPVNKALLSFSLAVLSLSLKAQKDSLATLMSRSVGSWINQDSTSVETWGTNGKGFEGWVNPVVSKKDEPLNLGIERSETLKLAYVDGQVCYVAITPQHNNDPVLFPLEGIDKYTYSFLNNENDFPKWIIYQRINNRTLQVILRSDDKEMRFYYFKIEPKGILNNE